MQQNQEQLLKLLVVGDSGTGKTSLVRRAVHGIWCGGSVRPTVGVDFAVKAVAFENTTVTLQLWDIAGQERYRNMTRTFYQNAAGACIVCDITNKASLKAAELWKQDIDAKVFVPGTNKPLPCILILNKCDLGEGECGSDAEINDFVSKNKFVGWMKTSAQDGTNVNDMFDKMIRHMKDAQKSAEPAGGAGGAAAQTTVNKVNFAAANKAPEEDKKKCAC